VGSDATSQEIVANPYVWQHKIFRSSLMDSVKCHYMWDNGPLVYKNIFYFLQYLFIQNIHITLLLYLLNDYEPQWLIIQIIFLQFHEQEIREHQTENNVTFFYNRIDYSVQKKDPNFRWLIKICFDIKL